MIGEYVYYVVLSFPYFCSKIFLMCEISSYIQMYSIIPGMRKVSQVYKTMEADTTVNLLTQMVYEGMWIQCMAGYASNT